MLKSLIMPSSLLHFSKSQFITFVDGKGGEHVASHALQWFTCFARICPYSLLIGKSILF